MLLLDEPFGARFHPPPHHARRRLRIWREEATRSSSSPTTSTRPCNSPTASSWAVEVAERAKVVEIDIAHPHLSVRRASRTAQRYPAAAQYRHKYERTGPAAKIEPVLVALALGGAAMGCGGMDAHQSLPRRRLLWERGVAELGRVLAYIGDSLRRVLLGFLAAAAVGIRRLGWYPVVNPVQMLRPWPIVDSGGDSHVRSQRRDAGISHLPLGVVSDRAFLRERLQRRRILHRSKPQFRTDTGAVAGACSLPDTADPRGTALAPRHRMGRNGGRRNDRGRLGTRLSGDRRPQLRQAVRPMVVAAMLTNRTHEDWPSISASVSCAISGRCVGGFAMSRRLA